MSIQISKQIEFLSEEHIANLTKLSKGDLRDCLFSYCEQGNLPVVQFILTSTLFKGKVNADSYYLGESPLYNACENNQFKVIEFLLDSKELKKNAEINVTIRSDGGLSDYIELAIMTNNTPLVKYLLLHPKLAINKHHSANLEEKDFFLQRCLTYACENDAVAVVDLLLYDKDLSFHPDVHYEKDSYIIICAELDSMSVMEYLLTSPKLETPLDIHTLDDLTFQRALEQNSQSCLDYLIFDYKIAYTPLIQVMCQSRLYESTKHKFEMRDLHHNLSQDVINTKPNFSKPKI